MQLAGETELGIGLRLVGEHEVPEGGDEVQRLEKRVAVAVGQAVLQAGEPGRDFGVRGKGLEHWNGGRVACPQDS